MIYTETMIGERDTLRIVNDYLMFFVHDLCDYDFARKRGESDAEWAKRMYVKINSLKSLADDCKQRMLLLACCDRSVQEGDSRDDEDSV